MRAHSANRWSLAVRTAAAGLFALAAWHANANICPGCAVRDVAVPARNGVIRGTLFLPAGKQDALPVVLVLHGYLASSAFMTVPWAADITGLGAAALFVDRAGHGRSDGTWWPPPRGAVWNVQTPDDLAPDLAAALAWLRQLAPLIDPWRIALLGHSDGGTAALLAASADWDVRATVALSPSAAPAEFLNHVAPRDLLLIYGADDDIVPPDGRATLMAAATRGYLAGPGSFGSLSDASARQLSTIAGAGHVGVLYSDAARSEALTWLQRALDLPGPVRLAHLRFGWIWLGLCALQVSLWWPLSGSPAAVWGPLLQPVRTGGLARRVGFVCGAWALGLLAGRWLARAMPVLPAQETRMLGAVLASGSAALAFAWAALAWLGRHHSRAIRDEGSMFGGIASGAAYALLLFACVHVLAWHLIAVPTGATRIALWGFYTAVGAPFFAALEGAMTRATSSPIAHAGALLAAAAILVITAPALAARMGVLPLYLLAATVGILALSVAGGVSWRWGVAGRATLAAVVLGRAIAVTCPLF